MADLSVIARFKSAEALAEAARAARAAGYRRLEAHAPFPVPEVTSALGFREHLVPVLALLAGMFVAGGAYLLQWYSAVVAYPFVTGGKPLHSWPTFLVIPFELGILAAVVTAVVTMLAGNRLPKPYHPAFDWAAFDRASSDGFFLLIEHDDGQALVAFFQRMGAAEIKELGP